MSTEQETGKAAAKVGRPTLYLPEYCECVVEMMREGASKHEAAWSLGVSYPTFVNWQEAHPEFLAAVKEGEALSRGWWERLGRQGASKAVQIDPTTYIFNMKNRFREDWNDTSKHELTGKDGKDLPPATVIFQPVAARDPEAHG